MKKRNYKTEKNYNKYLFNRALIAFLLTFGIITGVGIPALILSSSNDSATDNSSIFEKPENDSFSSKWELIPKVIKADAESNETSNDTDAPIADFNIPAEDANYTQVIASSSQDSITIGFAGDILFDDNYSVGNNFKVHGNSAVGVIGDSLLNRMNAVDIMMVNNEFPYSDRGTPTENKTFTFRAKPESVNALGSMGVDIVGLANNHAYDYGEQALIDTLDTLNNYGVRYVGAGKNIDEASHAVYYINQNGIKIAILCATQIERFQTPDTKEATATSAGVFRCLDDTLLLTRIKEAKEKGAFVIVFIHWGTESKTEIDYLQEKQASEIADAGANLIIGCHPHILQKIDYVHNVPVVYSLGNYIFNSKTMDSCMIIATINKDNTSNLQMIPAIQSDCKVNEAFGSEALRIYNNILSMSPNIIIDSNGYISPK